MPDKGNDTKEEMRFDRHCKTKPDVGLLVPPREVPVRIAFCVVCRLEI